MHLYFAGYTAYSKEAREANLDHLLESYLTFRNKTGKGEFVAWHQEKLVKISLAQKIRFHVSMIQKETKVLEEIHQFLNEQKIKNSLYIYKNGIGSIQFSSHKAVYLFLKQIYPYLHVKQKKAKLAIEFLEGKEKEVFSY